MMTAWLRPALWTLRTPCPNPFSRRRVWDAPRFTYSFSPLGSGIPRHSIALHAVPIEFRLRPRRYCRAREPPLPVIVMDEATYICDSCGEEIVIPLDVSEGVSQEYVED